jgi:branched-chain amino acid transport system ATP-binding protein
LLDEPAAGLDKDETAHLGSILRSVARERNLGLLLVEHDMNLVYAICDRVVVIDFGRAIFVGDVAEAFRSPLVRSAYLGEESAVREPEKDLATKGHPQG